MPIGMRYAKMHFMELSAECNASPNSCILARSDRIRCFNRFFRDCHALQLLEETQLRGLIHKCFSVVHKILCILMHPIQTAQILICQLANTANNLKLLTSHSLCTDFVLFVPAASSYMSRIACIVDCVRAPACLPVKSWKLFNCFTTIFITSTER